MVIQLSKALTQGIGQKLTTDIQKKLKTPPSISINIQITLPVTENEKVYQNIFKAIKENFIETERKTS